MFRATILFDYLPGNAGTYRILLLAVLIGFGMMKDSSCQAFNENVYYVSADGNDSSDGTFNSPWASVERALAETTPGELRPMKWCIIRLNIIYQKSKLRLKWLGITLYRFLHW